MRVIVFAALIFLVVAFGWLIGWGWWPFIAWPATGIAMISALLSRSPKGAGQGAAVTALAVWTAFVVFFVIQAYGPERDGRMHLVDPFDGLWIVARAVVLVGAPLALATGVLAALASWAGKRHQAAST